MPRVLIVAARSQAVDRFRSELARAGFDCAILPDADALDSDSAKAADLFLVQIGRKPPEHDRELVHMLRHDRNVPVIAFVDRDKLHSFDTELGVDDFVVETCDPAELALRAKRLVRKSRAVTAGSEAIVCGDLVIDLAACEVTLGGRLVMLTFKEYELLKFLARNKGRVFSREALLDKVWGFDYFGGDRTVDVHIRRLRSKIEDANHSFVETVRNIGYRFRDDL